MNGHTTGKTNAVVLAGMATALGVVLSMIGLYLPVFSSAIFMLVPLPIAYLGMREGTSWAIVVAVGLLILDTVFFGIVSAAFLCGIFGILGVVMGFCYHRRIRASYTLVAGALAVLIALIAESYAALYLLGLPSLFFGGEALQEIEQAMMVPLSELYAGEMLEQAKENVSVMIQMMERSIPFAVVAVAFFYSWASMTMGKYIFHRMGIRDIPHLAPLERWEMPRWFLGLYLIVMVIQNFFPLEGRPDILVYNVGLLCIMVFWLHGIATLWWAPRRYGFMRILRWFFLGFSMVNGIVQMIIVCLGLYDMLSGYRRKKNYV